MTGFGVFVVVDEPFVEGLVRVDELVPTTTTSSTTPRCGWWGGGPAAPSRWATRPGRGAVGQRGAAEDRLPPRRARASGGARPGGRRQARRRRGEKGAEKHRLKDAGRDRRDSGKRKRVKPKPPRKPGRKRPRR